MPDFHYSEYLALERYLHGCSQKSLDLSRPPVDSINSKTERSFVKSLQKNIQQLKEGSFQDDLLAMHSWGRERIRRATLGNKCRVRRPVERQKGHAGNLYAFVRLAVSPLVLSGKTAVEILFFCSPLSEKGGLYRGNREKIANMRKTFNHIKTLSEEEKSKIKEQISDDLVKFGCGVVGSACIGAAAVGAPVFIPAAVVGGAVCMGGIAAKARYGKKNLKQGGELAADLTVDLVRSILSAGAGSAIFLSGSQESFTFIEAATDFLDASSALADAGYIYDSQTIIGELSENQEKILHQQAEKQKEGIAVIDPTKKEEEKILSDFDIASSLSRGRSKNKKHRRRRSSSNDSDSPEHRVSMGSRRSESHFPPDKKHRRKNKKLSSSAPASCSSKRSARGERRRHHSS